MYWIVLCSQRIYHDVMLINELSGQRALLQYLINLFRTGTCLEQSKLETLSVTIEETQKIHIIL